MDLQLKGKRALVTGSTAGIGFAIAAESGARRRKGHLNGRTQEGVDNAAAAIKAETGVDVVGFAGDLGRADAAEALIERHPEIDILVNNLGIFEPKPFEEIPDADWHALFRGQRAQRRAARPPLSARHEAAANWGRIIFISSESGLQIPAEMIHYGVTKTAQIAVARGIAEVACGDRDHRQ